MSACLSFEDRKRAQRRVDRLEKQDHNLTLLRWTVLLNLLLPGEYADLPPPEDPAPKGLSRQQREEVMAERIAAGESAFHPDDPWAWDDGSDYPGGFVARNGRNGTTYEGEAVCNG